MNKKSLATLSNSGELIKPPCTKLSKKLFNGQE
uniref:Uncharacterized protein n=1 Tax=viral metagenome TaxID=1070528 RepID=A0A6C0H0R3_9ZZZZ